MNSPTQLNHARSIDKAKQSRARNTARTFRSGAASFLRAAHPAVALLLLCSMVPAGIGNLYAQEDAPGPEYRQSTYDQLDQLVAPIALYPDSLVAQILAAATYAPQVMEADSFVQQNAGIPPAKLARLANEQPWDPSVKALVAFPSVLSQLDRNLDWTTRLGNAYYNQPQDVMTAVQAMRGRAYAAGMLRSTPQQTVVYAPSDIVIRPANPAVVYVPAYNPWVVYGAPVGVYPAYVYVAPPARPAGAVVATAAIGFTVGVAVGAFAHYGWGWNHWGCGWGPHPVIAYNHVTYVSRSVTVVNHGYYGRYDHSVTAYGPHGGVYTDQRGSVNGQYTDTRTATGAHGASYTDQRTAGDGQYSNTRTATRANGATYTDQRTVANGVSTNTRTATGVNGRTYSGTTTRGAGETSTTVTGPNGRTASGTTTRYLGGNSTTVTGPNGKTATRTVTGRGTGDATVTRSGPKGRKTHARHRHRW
ncbi:MAG: DUF3300 domain-containing protein [Acidobacteriaceae bacterium]